MSSDCGRLLLRRLQTSPLAATIKLSTRRLHSPDMNLWNLYQPLARDQPTSQWSVQHHSGQEEEQFPPSCLHVNVPLHSTLHHCLTSQPHGPLQKPRMNGETLFMTTARRLKTSLKSTSSKLCSPTGTFRAWTSPEIGPQLPQKELLHVPLPPKRPLSRSVNKHLVTMVTFTYVLILLCC